MKRLLKLAFAAALTLTAILTTPRTGAAGPIHCTLCAQTGDCVQCCKCDGGSSPYCLLYCGG